MEIRGARRAGRAVQAAYLVYVVLALTVAALGLSVHYRDPWLIGSPQYLALMQELGIPFAVATTVSFVLPIFGAAVLAAAVFLGRRDDAVALLFAAGLLGLFVFYSASPRAFALTYPRLSGVALLVETVGLASVAVLLYVFPDGRFRPRWTLPFASAVLAVLLVVPDLAATARLLIIAPDDQPTWKVVLVVVTLAVLLATAAPAQVIRYQRHCGPVERQQQRWILFGLSVVLVPALVVLASIALGAGRWTTWVLFAMALLGFVLPGAAAVALFRYRLFDLDRVVSRTVSWTVLTALLAATYSGLIVTLQALLAPLAGGSNLAVAGSTLTVAALFSTVRRRTQALVDRAFHRTRYDARRVVGEFERAVREARPRDELVGGLTHVVQHALQPAAMGVWLRDGGSERDQATR